eukprot:TRINITY_DN671_c0_g1_i1.p1 TRINITY_DN671_c0_g1~~TRINITY_DN671_c0_g1_i1.p1  ORF type:complete len:257 (+),score=53.79 TRINITY_DN671_c0_g1_i1:46-816(+)
MMSHSSRASLLVLMVLIFVNVSQSIYFILEDGQTRCFLEEIPKDTLVLGRFKAELQTEAKAGEQKKLSPVQFAQRGRKGGPRGIPPLPAGGAEEQQQMPPGDVGIKVVVTDPEGHNTIPSRVTPLEGRFAFTSQLGGEHKMCFQTNTTGGWFGGKRKLKFHLDIETGEGATDYEDIAKQEHLSALEVEVRKLNDRIKDIRAEQNYQRNRESSFRDTSESTNSRVVWWSVIQTAILLAAGFWQISHLKHFFKTKKLV